MESDNIVNLEELFIKLYDMWYMDWVDDSFEEYVEKLDIGVYILPKTKHARIKDFNKFFLAKIKYGI